RKGATSSPRRPGSASLPAFASVSCWYPSIWWAKACASDWIRICPVARMPDAVVPDAPTHAGAALHVQGLSVAYASRTGWLQALDNVSLSIPPGAVLGLVGESGS